MDKNSEQITEHIRSARRELGSNLQELESKVKDATNWRVQFQRHPVALLGAAFAGGILLSAVFGRGNRRAEGRLPQAVARPIPQTARDESSSSAADIWRDIKGAVGAAVVGQVYAILDDFIPGLSEQAAGRAIAPQRKSKSRTAVHSGNGGHEQSSSPPLPLD